MQICPQRQRSQEPASLFYDHLLWTSAHPRNLRPRLDSFFFSVPNIFWKRPSLAVSLWNYPYSSSPPPPFSQASSSGPRSLYQLLFFLSRDLPPQSHKSTEDRCLLCLIKALPPGVIPQFEQEEKPSEGGGCSGSILWRAHIIHSHLDFTKEKQPASVLKPTIPSPPTTSDCSPFLFVFIFILLPFLSLLICFFRRCYCQQVSWHTSRLARGSSFSAACLPEEGWGWLVLCWWKRVHTVDVCWQEHKPQCFSHSVHKGLGIYRYWRWRSEDICQVSLAGNLAHVSWVIHAQISSKCC